ncbi:MAG: glycosyltransferase family 4 protein [Anaerolineae bacterium]|nr:glycosyltransferase family 4 protein [Anaerolineae bacterium]
MLTPRRIGLISTRFAGTDGVSLESRKWVEVLEKLGHHCFYFAGECDRGPDCARVVPEAHFRHPDVWEIYNTAFSQAVRPPATSRRVAELQGFLKEQLYEFVRAFDIELLIVQNALSIPMNVPLGMALTEFIAETEFLTIAHHHDFYWERQRFLTNCIRDYLNMAFPPHFPSMRHVVINSLAANQLSLRTGISSLLIPNVMDFDNPPEPPDSYADDLRAELRLTPDQYLILQPTRVVARKGIEHAVELVKRLGLDAQLIVSHESGDEGDGYAEHLRTFAALLDVPIRFESERIHSERGRTGDGRKIYSLRDVYQQAQLVTYPSTVEGFGNAFLEAVYFRRPLLINNYSIFALDIKPKGFQVIEFDGYINASTVERTRQVLSDPFRARQMVETNYQLAKRHYSYAVLERHLETILSQHFGE